MAKPKAQSKKQQKHGVDFKKIRRKIGRKLPPAKNSTNTEVKSKAIILPEQSVASDKAGLSLSKKGLTLKELLHQTSHHNAKIRKDALIGIRDIFLKYPEELKLHKLIVIEKLSERISDDDKLVRETLYQLLKAVIFPGFKEDNQGRLITLMMAFVFNTMTHLVVDIRLTAFRFLDLIVQFYPDAFSLYSYKILRSYEDTLRKNLLYLQEEGRLKSVLAGLVRCLSLLLSDMSGIDSSIQNAADNQRISHTFEFDVPKDPFEIPSVAIDLLPILISSFQDFVPSVHLKPVLDAESFDCMSYLLQCIDHLVKFLIDDVNRSEQDLGGPSARSAGSLPRDQMLLPTPILKKFLDFFPLYPTNELSEKGDSRCAVLNLKASEIFLYLSDRISFPPELLEKFLQLISSALIEMMSSNAKAHCQKHILSLIPYIPKLVVQVTGSWKCRILEAFTEGFRKCNPNSPLKLAFLRAVEEMLLCKQGWVYLNANDSGLWDFQIVWIQELASLLTILGNSFPECSRAVLHLILRLGQHASRNPFFTQEYDRVQCSLRDFYGSCFDGKVCYGPFMILPRDVQELSICCIYYFSFTDPILLQSIGSCCLCHDLDPDVLLRILDVLHSTYKAGRIVPADYISFLSTLLLRFPVCPEKTSTLEKGGKLNRRAIKSITSRISLFLSGIGDPYFIFLMIEKVFDDQLSTKAPFENICALLRLVSKLDTQLSERSIVKLGLILPDYVIDVMSCVPEGATESAVNFRTSRSYYLLPCFILFDRSNGLLNHVLNAMGSSVLENFSSCSFPAWNLHAVDYSSRIEAIVSFLLQLHSFTRMQQLLLSCKREIDSILQNIHILKCSEAINLTIEKRHKILGAYDRLIAATSKIFGEKYQNSEGMLSKI